MRRSGSGCSDSPLLTSAPYGSLLLGLVKRSCATTGFRFSLSENVSSPMTHFFASSRAVAGGLSVVTLGYNGTLLPPAPRRGVAAHFSPFRDPQAGLRGMGEPRPPPTASSHVLHEGKLRWI